MSQSSFRDEKNFEVEALDENVFRIRYFNHLPIERIYKILLIVESRYAHNENFIGRKKSFTCFAT